MPHPIYPLYDYGGLAKRNLITHPLTHEVIEEPDRASDMSDAYNLAIDECVAWLNSHGTDDPQETAKRLRQALHMP